jgi:predicted NACHT family NTPase
LLILLDGLDELPIKNLNEAIIQIQNFVDQYDKIASLPPVTAAYRSSFRRFTNVVLADFDAQIEQFICNWFHSEADKEAGTAEKCWQLLQKKENKGAKELAHTPLLLTFLCLVYDSSQSFPDNRSVLYRKALRILLEEWASEKRILRDEIYQGLHTELEDTLIRNCLYQFRVRPAISLSARLLRKSKPFDGQS